MAPRLTAFDSLRLQRYLTVPTTLAGSIAPNPRFWPYAVRHNATGTTLRFLRGVRKKYGPRVWTWFPFGSTLLVLDRAGIEEVLSSGDTFADSTIKKFLLRTFTPYGVIVSRDTPWHTRRALNSDALAFGHPEHPDGNQFVAIVDVEVQKMLERIPDVLVWDDFSALAARISQQVILGLEEYREGLAVHLADLVAGSNWGIPRRSDFSAFHGQIDEHLNRARRTGGNSGSLVKRTAHWLTTNSSATDVQPSSQIAFWLFVLKDALELHTVRTLALIASAPDAVRHRLQEELSTFTSPSADAVARLQFLEACIREEVRLWTADPILLRVAVEPTKLSECGTGDSVEVAKDQQILLATGFYHRDAEVFGAAADRFRPEERLLAALPDGGSMMNSDPPLYIFAAHRQACAGQFLVILLLKAVLATLLTQNQMKVPRLDPSVAMDPVPEAINHFAMRFWRR